jgi:hypothetical protein
MTAEEVVKPTARNLIQEFDAVATNDLYYNPNEEEIMQLNVIWNNNLHF